MRSLPDLKLTVMLFEPTVKALAATGRRTVSEATQSPNGVTHLAIDRIGICHIPLDLDISLAMLL
jgi:hypothetical protein